MDNELIYWLRNFNVSCETQAIAADRIEALEDENAEFRIECKNLAHQVGYEKQAKEYKQTRIEALEGALLNLWKAVGFTDHLWLNPETRELIKGLE